MSLECGDVVSENIANILVMKRTFFIVAAILVFGLLPVPVLPTFAQQTDLAKSSADTAPLLKVEAVSRDERRQQILAGIHESRFSCILERVPEEVTFSPSVI